MKKAAAFLIAAMILFVSISVVFNIFSSDSFSSEGNLIERTEKAISENIPFREELSDLMDGIRYISGVRHFGDIYIGSEGSLLKEIERPTSRIFSASENYIVAFAEKLQTKPYFMLVPTALPILSQEVDAFASENIFNQRNMINQMYTRFDGKVRTTDIYQTLYDRRDEYIYYHTEDLPTCLGGYYIYGELCSRLGIEQNTMDSFSAAYVARGFYGSLADDFFRPYVSPDFVTLYEYSGEKRDYMIERKYPDGKSDISHSVFIYDESLFEDKTDMIFGGLAPVMEISLLKTEEKSSSILIFGDESAKSWLPFLITNFDRTTFVDLDAASPELLSAISASEYDSILFAYSTSAFSLGIDFEKLEYVG